MASALTSVSHTTNEPEKTISDLVGDINEDRVVDAGGQHGLHDIPRTWRVAGIQQHLVVTAGQGKRLAFDGVLILGLLGDGQSRER